MSNIDFEEWRSLTPSQMAILVSLLRLKDATAYSLAKWTGMSYATMYGGVRRLQRIGLLAMTAVVSGKGRGGQKMIFALTLKGRTFAEKIQREQNQREIDNLKSRLLHSGQNPTLEDKIAALEQEVRKAYLSPMTDFKKNDENIDLLKTYKNAAKRIFVIMPFASGSDDVWKGAIERAGSSEGYVCLRADRISLSSWITEDLEKCIERADFVIADITETNPNVMFELGWALAKGKKPIVIRQQDAPSQVPFDVASIRYVPYTNTWSGIERLYHELSKFLHVVSPTKSFDQSRREDRNEPS